MAMAGQRQLGEAHAEPEHKLDLKTPILPIVLARTEKKPKKVEKPPKETAKPPIPELTEGRVIAVIINGSDEERHKKNADVAIDALKSRGVKNFFIIGDYSDVDKLKANKFEATNKGLEEFATALGAHVKDGDTVITYVTGKGEVKSERDISYEYNFLLKNGEKIEYYKLYRKYAPLNARSIIIGDCPYFGFSNKSEIIISTAVRRAETNSSAFANAFWSGIKTGNYGNTLEKIFEKSIEAYNADEKEGAKVDGLFIRSIPPPLRSMGQLEKGKVIVMFTADWCEPCKKVKPLVKEMYSEYGHQIKFYSVNTDWRSNPLRYEAEKRFFKIGELELPTFLFLKDGKLIKKIIGEAEKDIKELQNAPKEIFGATPLPKNKE